MLPVHLNSTVTRLFNDLVLLRKLDRVTDKSYSLEIKL